MMVTDSAISDKVFRSAMQLKSEADPGAFYGARNSFSSGRRNEKHDLLLESFLETKSCNKDY